MALAKSDQSYLCILWVILSVLLKTYRLLLSAHALMYFQVISDPRFSFFKQL